MRANKFLVILVTLIIYFSCATTEHELSVSDSERTNEDLLRAAKYGDIGEVRISLQAGADLSAADDAGYTALILAVCNGHVQVARLLIGA